MRFVTTIAFLAAVAGSVPAGLGAQQQAAAPSRVVFIRSQAVLEVAPGRADAEQAFTREMESYRGQIQRMTDSLGRMVEDYRKAQPTLSAAQREQREGAIRTRQEEYARREQQIQQTAQQRQAELMQPITEQIRGLLEEMRAAEGWSVVLDLDAGGAVVAFDKSLDVTDRVAARLRTMPRPAASAPRPQGNTPAPAAGRPQGAPAGPVAAPAGVGRPKPPTE